MKHTLLLIALFGLSATSSVHGQAARDIDKINGRITAEAGQAYGDLSTVNGGVHLANGARAQDVDTVNGSVDAGDDVSTHDVATVNGSIHFGKRANVAGDVETVNGGIFLDRGSRVRGGASTVNGGIGLVETQLGGSIETVAGDITVGVGSRVSGGIRVDKPTGKWNLQIGKQKIPRVVIGPNAVVDGPLVFEREVKLYVHGSARTGKITGATAIRFDTPTPPKD